MVHFDTTHPSGSISPISSAQVLLIGGALSDAPASAQPAAPDEAFVPLGADLGTGMDLAATKAWGQKRSPNQG